MESSVDGRNTSKRKVSECFFKEEQLASNCSYLGAVYNVDWDLCARYASKLLLRFTSVETCSTISFIPSEKPVHLVAAIFLCKFHVYYEVTNVLSYMMMTMMSQDHVLAAIKLQCFQP